MMNEYFYVPGWEIVIVKRINKYRGHFFQVKWKRAYEQKWTAGKTAKHRIDLLQEIQFLQRLHAPKAADMNMLR